MKRHFIYMRANAEGVISSAWQLWLGSSLPDVKRARQLYTLAESLGDFFSLVSHETMAMIENTTPVIRPIETDFQTLTKQQLL